MWLDGLCGRGSGVAVDVGNLRAATLAVNDDVALVRWGTALFTSNQLLAMKERRDRVRCDSAS